MTPKKLYSTLAVAETITWALLIGGMILKYTNVTPLGVRIAGGIHGFVFLTYCVATVMIWMNNRWSFGRGILGLLSSVIPFATIPFEKQADKAGVLNGAWRFTADALDPHERPGNVAEHGLAFAVRKPIVTLIVVLIAVALVFSGLLALGSPLEWFKN
ncbi:DUF3817 domain-containing protein [Corynebacterium auriscanis]|uniref:DUF3817 domain-containing protein n=1 Tax=Corynebacterium auriscanis TaxID=99807 RepID=UPI0024AE266C|nr:DUF3817 domain-containing protein [Corynebacterium auriscanis]